MKPFFLLRLILDLAAASFLLAALAYNWMGNLAHEMIGTLMFALLISHNLFNRRWYGTITKKRPEPAHLIIKGINLSLLLSMLALLVTSVIISQAVFSFLPFTSTVGVRQIHAMVGYVALLVVGVHLGLHWTIIMRVLRKLFGTSDQSRVRTMVLRVLAIGIAAFGVQSLIVVNVASKLLMELSLHFWDYEAASLAFVTRHVAIIGLCAVIGHYAVQLVRLVSARS